MRTPAERFHPGEYLAEETRERRWRVACFAVRAGLSIEEIQGILECRLPITETSARAIGAALGTSAEYWINLQRIYDGEEVSDAS